MTLKRSLRRSIDRVAHITGVMGRAQRRMSRGVTALMYHRILPDERALAYAQPALAIPASAFEQQVRWLAANCTVLPLRDALMANAKATRSERPLVALTFDDGYADNAEIAAPILERAGVRGTFFVTAKLIETGELLWYDRAAVMWRSVTAAQRAARVQGLGMAQGRADADVSLHDWLEFLKRSEPRTRAAILDTFAAGSSVDEQSRAQHRLMTRSQVAQLHQRGHEIGSHSLTHPLLPQLDDRTLAQEVSGSFDLLRTWLGEAPVGFCYPNGDHDERIVATVRDAGYGYACTTRSGLNPPDEDPFRLLRRDITMRRVLSASGAHDEVAFLAEVCGFHEGMR